MPAPYDTDLLIKRYSICTQRIQTLAKNADRDILLLVVSKSRSIDSIRALHHAGQRNFGENYLQEALPKIIELSDCAAICWHFIGHVQRNKTQLIATHFDWVQSIDSPLIATRLNAAREKLCLAPLNICVQINIDLDAHKFGVALDQLQPLLEHIQQHCAHLRLRGLMILPTQHHSPEETRLTFQRARDVFDALNKEGFALDTLSMGMSEDMKEAIESGSTMLRIGRGIFEERRTVNVHRD